MSDQEKTLQSKMQDRLAETISGLFGSVLSDRSQYFKENPDKIPQSYEISTLIKSYARTNAAISGTASLIPGPWGMMAVIPELVAVTRNQIVMIHEIGMAHGKGKLITKELLAGIFLSALGTGATSLLVLHGSKVLVKKASLKTFEKIIVILAGKISQQVLKSTISKWLPVVGAAAMAAWSGHMTHQIGNKANEIFNKDIIVENSSIEEASFEEYAENSKDIEISELSIEEEISQVQEIIPETKESHSLNVLKIQSLIYLMKIDGSVEPKEKEFILTIIRAANLTAPEIAKIRSILASEEKIKIDYSGFKNHPEDAIDLLIDLITLAHRDGNFHITEKMYIKQVGRLLDFPDSDVEDIIDSVNSL